MQQTLDREGEAIAWHLQEALGADKFNYSRVRFNQITKDAILESFEDPKDIDANLVEAQQARRFLIESLVWNYLHFYGQKLPVIYQRKSSICCTKTFSGRTRA